jgi:hypothetical protein
VALAEAVAARFVDLGGGGAAIGGAAAAIEGEGVEKIVPEDLLRGFRIVGEIGADAVVDGRRVGPCRGGGEGLGHTQARARHGACAVVDADAFEYLDGGPGERARIVIAALFEDRALQHQRGERGLRVVLAVHAQRLAERAAGEHFGLGRTALAQLEPGALDEQADMGGPQRFDGTVQDVGKFERAVERRERQPEGVLGLRITAGRLQHPRLCRIDREARYGIERLVVLAAGDRRRQFVLQPGDELFGLLDFAGLDIGVDETGRRAEAADLFRLAHALFGVAERGAHVAGLRFDEDEQRQDLVALGGVARDVERRGQVGERLGVAAEIDAGEGAVEQRLDPFRPAAVDPRRRALAQGGDTGGVGAFLVEHSGDVARRPARGRRWFGRNGRGRGQFGNAAAPLVVARGPAHLFAHDGVQRGRIVQGADVGPARVRAAAGALDLLADDEGVVGAGADGDGFAPRDLGADRDLRAVAAGGTEGEDKADPVLRGVADRERPQAGERRARLVVERIRFDSGSVAAAAQAAQRIERARRAFADRFDSGIEDELAAVGEAAAGRHAVDGGHRALPVLI